MVRAFSSKSNCPVPDVEAIVPLCLPDCTPPAAPAPITPEPPIIVIPTPPIPGMDAGCFPLRIETSAEMADGEWLSSESSGSMVPYFKPAEPELEAEIEYQGGDNCRPKINLNMKIPRTQPSAGVEAYQACVNETSPLNFYSNISDGEGNTYTIRGRIERGEEGHIDLYKPNSSTGEMELYQSNVLASTQICVQSRECGTAVQSGGTKWAFIPDLKPRLGMTKTGIDADDDGPVWFIDEEDGTTKIGPYTSGGALETISAHNRGQYVAPNTLVMLYKADATDAQCDFFFLA